MGGKDNHSLVAAILIAALIVGGSNVFVGARLQGGAVSVGGGNVDEAALLAKIDKGIESYVERQQKEQEKAQEDAKKQADEAAQNVKAPSDKDHIRGSKDARISLIEYSDYECPFCKRFHPTAQEVVNHYNGKVNWIYRHYPLGFHDPVATQLAVAGECVAEQKGSAAFWTYSDAVYGNSDPINDALIKKFAVAAGADGGKFDTCMKSGKYEAKVRQDITEGSSAGISGTPGNIIYDNKTGKARLLPGAYPFEEFQRVIDEMLAS